MEAATGNRCSRNVPCCRRCAPFSAALKEMQQESNSVLVCSNFFLELHSWLYLELDSLLSSHELWTEKSFLKFMCRTCNGCSTQRARTETTGDKVSLHLLSVLVFVSNGSCFSTCASQNQSLCVAFSGA